MARADRRRDARAKPVAAGAERHQSAYVGTEDLFFQRLRKQAKWVFVFLAFVFAVLASSSSASAPRCRAASPTSSRAAAAGGGDVEGARERTQENPAEADAWRDLATALQQDGRPEEAIAPLERYVALEPKDADALGNLASLYLVRAGDLSERAARRRRRGRRWTTPASPSPSVGFPVRAGVRDESGHGRARRRVERRVNDLYTRTTQAYQEAKLKYAQLAELQPEDASVQIQLAQAAENAGDYPSAIAAYKKFLTLAPDDPSAAAVKARVEQLEAASAASPTTGG